MYTTAAIAPVDFIPSINLFITPTCNMRCKFCFGVCKFDNLPSLKEQQNIMLKVIEVCASAQIQKITFVGGEPLLCSWLTKAIAKAHELGMSTCVVTNGALVTKNWLQRNSVQLDWIGYSIDSMTQSTNVNSGRSVKGEALSATHYRNIVSWTHEANIKLKINTTVTHWNKHEDISQFLNWATPHRIKMFQAVTINGINDGQSFNFSVSDTEFAAYIDRHTANGVPVVAESSSDMKGSYLMVAPDGRFFDSTSGRYKLGRPIQQVGFHEALSDIQCDPDLFQKRGGLYNW